MSYVEVVTEKRTALFPLEPSGWGMPYQALIDRTDVSGWEMWLAACYNNFSNDFANAIEGLHNTMGGSAKGDYDTILRDKILRGGRKVENGLEIEYLSHAGIPELERRHTIVAPKIGGYVIPTCDSTYIEEDGIWIPYHHGTLVPHATEMNKEVAVGILADYLKKYMDDTNAQKVAERWIPYFCEHDPDQEEELFIAIGFYPSWISRLCIGRARPSSRGDKATGSFLRYERSQRVRYVPAEAMTEEKTMPKGSM